MYGCEIIVTMEHSEGCADVGVDVDRAMGWLSDNEWALGIIYLVVGPFIALFGLKYFHVVTAGITALFIMIVCLYISMSAGWMATTGGTIGVVVVSVNLGIIAGCIVKRYIWLMVGMLGLVGGFFAGSAIFAILYGTTGWREMWGFWLIAISLALIGMWAACTLGQTVVLFSTALIGSYLFMRAWTMFFPEHYPSEADIFSEEAMDLEVDPIFWVFIGVFLASFVGSASYQYGQGHDNDDVYDYHKQDDSD